MNKERITWIKSNQLAINIIIKSQTTGKLDKLEIIDQVSKNAHNYEISNSPPKSIEQNISVVGEEPSFL